MSVYVDDMRRPARPSGYRGRGTPRWTHLMADTSGELFGMASRLGLNHAWIQHPGTHREHFDVTETIRNQAIRLGAEPIGYPRGTGELLARKRAGWQPADTAVTG